MHDDELIKIKKREKKKKAQREKTKAQKTKRSAPRVKSVPRAKGVKLDFTEEAPEVNRYYIGISKRYRVAKYVSVVLLCAFLFVMLVFYRENITYANLLYLARDLDSQGELNVGAYNDISYDRSFENDYDFFRQRVAVASPTGFSLYSYAGFSDLFVEDIVAAPRLEVSDKYALVYGAGEKDYSVYTSIARVLSAECEFEVADAAVCDSGRYALLTGDDEARYMVTVYSEDFSPVARYHMNRFVMDLALSTNGDELCVVSSDVVGAGVQGELMISPVGEKEEKTVSLEGMMPISCEYTENGRIVVLCDSALLVFDGTKEVARVGFNSLTPGYYSIAGDKVAISFPTNAIGSENRVCVYDLSGKELMKKEISSKATALSMNEEGVVFVAGDSEVYRLSADSKEIKSEPLRDQAVCALAHAGGVVICSPEGASSYFVNDGE